MKVKNEDPGRLNILGGDLSPSHEIGALLKLWHRKLNYFSMFAALPLIMAAEARDAQADEWKKPEAPIADRTEKLRGGPSNNFSKPDLLRRRSNYFLPHQKGKYNMVSAFTGGDNCPGAPIPAGTYTEAAPFTDSGDTTGANNTVSQLSSFYYYSYGANGPDLIYSFTLTARGAVPQIRVTPGSPTYRPAIYILDGRRNGCPAETGNFASNWLALSYSNNALPGPVMINRAQMNNLPLNVPLHLFIDSYGSAPPASSGPYTLSMQDVTIGTLPGNDAPGDLNGDGKTDFTVIRNTGGGESGQATWFTKRSDGVIDSPVNWGIASDQFVPADYDIDGKDDLAVFRPGPQGRFYIIESRASTLRVEDFGQTGDSAVVADYDGDNRDDIAVYRNGSTPGAQSFWFYKFQGASFFAQISWGQNGDVPAPGDYDGDGRSDFVIRRAHPNGVDGRFYKRLTSNQIVIEDFGKALDKIVPGDYDGDGRIDLAVVRPGTDGFLVWEFEPSGTAGISVVRAVWGVAATDIITPGDYDGDGKTEYSVWRPGTPGVFYMLTAGTGRFTTTAWGAAGDIPVASYNVR